ncbi:sterol 3-beta-glucosyltransferase UGT80A2 isoform X3 [Jatropha curcas]|uniref:sterol 3-beta-glucosyltransferase UGT80A2 isoform X3 n=1 Tax=Jatropha curcas TaxID=180498 RepID=UPI0005FABDEB|nr:sterol 3-beta-glucosyltransferase UGT80A2 isoform X3 [Jatropha curcas]
MVESPENRRRSSSSSSSSSSGEVSVRIERKLGAGTSTEGKELEGTAAAAGSVTNGGPDSSGIAGKSTSKLNPSQIEVSGANELKPTSSELKLERSKTERQRHHNILAEEAKQIFDEKIPVQQKLQLLKRIATVKDDGTVEFEVPGDVEARALGIGSDDVYNTVTDDEPVDATDIQYIPPLQIVMLIVGTRGDVQPFIAIGKKLQDYGHRVRLATHSNFKEFVLTAGLEFYPLGGDPKVLAGYMVKNKGFLPSGPSEIPVQRNQMKEIIYSLLPACKDPDMDSGIPFKADAIIANPPAYDWGPKVDVVGFCFLDLASNYEPPESLVKWLEAGPKPIYIGFGSLPVQEPEKMTQIIVDALEQTGQRGIINKGWGGLGNLAEPKDSIYLLDNCPHDWLFLRCKAVVHHGGAGTTAAGLKAACPTTIVPFFGDQPFWGERVYARGVGPQPIPVDEFSLPKLIDAIKIMLDPKVKERAIELAKAMENEDGVTGAVKAFFKHLPKMKPEPEPSPEPSSFFSFRRCFGCS